VSTRHSNLALIRPGTRRKSSAPAALNRREHERLAARDLAWLDLARLKYGPAVSLLDLSAGGAQIESSGLILKPGASVVIEIAGRDCEFAVPSQIVRCQVSRISPRMVYRGALEFRRRIDLPDDAGLAAHAALSDVTGVGAGALAAAQAMIQSTASRSGDGPFSAHAGRLLQALALSLEQRESPDALARRVIDALGQSVSPQSIRLIDGAAPLSLPNSDTVAFDVPSASGLKTKLLVEFSRGKRFEEWHRHLLETAAHLFTIATDVGRAPLVVTGQTKRRAPSAIPVGWHGLMVRYRDGRTLKGYGRDFSPQRGRFQLWSSPQADCPPESRITVPLGNLKAVNFVRRLDGELIPSEPAAKTTEPGRPIIITFFDGEVLMAKTLNYNEKAPGYFVTPLDKPTNNLRIYVVSRAIARVQFP
jgi:uncharacterized protein DUF6982/PilZ domain-containing protein